METSLYTSTLKCFCDNKKKEDKTFNKNTLVSGLRFTADDK